ncbi:MAG: DNA gyrase inhibitor YacG [Planctomycetaceae bacterium]
MIRPQSCPICKKALPANSATELATFPFCSVRCREVDLYRWSVGKYAIVESADPADLELYEADLAQSDDDRTDGWNDRVDDED